MFAPLGIGQEHCPIYISFMILMLVLGIETGQKAKLLLVAGQCLGGTVCPGSEIKPLRQWELFAWRRRNDKYFGKATADGLGGRTSRTLEKGATRTNPVL